MVMLKLPGTDYEYSCLNYDLMGHITLEEMDAEAGNDCWGWTDASTGREYAIMGVNNGTAFIDITLIPHHLFILANFQLLLSLVHGET